MDDQDKDQVREPSAHEVEVVLDPGAATAPALYSNVCIPNVLDENLFLDFLLADPVSLNPNAPRPVPGRHVARIVLSREAAQRLKKVLNERMR